MNCKICNSSAPLVFKEKVLKKYDVEFYQCDKCGFLFSEEPYWIEEAYGNAITYSDSGIILRNIQFSKICSVTIDLFFNRKDRFLDYAGGYGLFTRMMRDYGFDFYWTDKYCENLFAKGFEHDEKVDSKFEIVTAFEVFEHFVDPVVELEKILSFSNNVIFSTELLSQPIPDPKEWWYYSFIHGQHISFYTYKSLSLLAKRFNLNFYSMGNIHIITDKKLNEFLLKLLKKASLAFLFDVLKFRYKSKTFDDHLLMSKSASQS
ncbi:MAG: class I SAM-dependent methyltransferase [Ignavibacteriaceae bacterium]|nr:class I SAM-dependent methyltransferase [Ignavibacteriaceae bacterium]